jgi:hypothetical protein
MARIEIYSNDSNVTLDDKVIGTDALDNSTKNFTVGDMLSLSSVGPTYTAGAGISITNGVISSTIVDTDTNNFVSNVALNGTSLDFTGTGGAFQSSVQLSSIADQTVTLVGTGGIAVTGTYPSFTIDGSAISGGGGGTVTGTGSPNIMTKWISNTQIGSTFVVEDGNGVGIGINPPEARLHVHAPSNSCTLKITTQGSGASAQDGLNISLIDNQFGQMWLYEPNISLRFGTNNAERFRIDGAGQGWFQYGLRVTGGIVDSNTTKGTAGQILSSTGSQVEWVNAPSGASTLSALTDTTLTNPSNGDYLQYNGTNWVNVSGAYPERLILRAQQISILPNGSDLLFASTGNNVKSSSMHINPAELSDVTSGFEVISDCVARIALGAYVDRQGHSGEVLFKIQETSSGTSVLAGEASFSISNQATAPEAFSFFSFFQLQAGEEYLFTAQAVGSNNNAFRLEPGTFIEIEIVK